MAFQAVGTAIAQELVFNSGLLTLNGNQVFEILDLNVTQGLTEKSFFTLNSIFKRAIARSHYEAKVTFTVKTNPIDLQNAFYSSSSMDGSDVVYSVLDGQQVAFTKFMITAYTNAASTKGYQFELTNATIVKMDTALTTEDFAGVSVEVACTKLTNVRRIP